MSPYSTVGMESGIVQGKKEVGSFRRPATVIGTKTAECHCNAQGVMGRRGE